jgi:sugar phosphate isomerase/epimerase
MWRTGVITDEIDNDLEQALAVAQELGLIEVELNNLWGRNIVELSDAEVETAARLIQEGGFRVPVIDIPAFKAILLDGLASPEESPEFQTHLTWVRRGCQLAQRFGVSFVRVFSFRKSGMQGLGNPSPRLPRGGPIPDDMLEKIATGLRIAAGVAREQGITLLLENVRSCWGNSCWNAAQIIAATDHPALQAIWDPGNDYVSGGDPFPEGYEALRPWMTHVHLKNAVVLDAETGLTGWQRIGGGDMDFAPMLHRLKSDGYAGVIALETHWRGDNLTAEASTRRSFADLRELVTALGPR